MERCGSKANDWKLDFDEPLASVNPAVRPHLRRILAFWKNLGNVRAARR